MNLVYIAKVQPFTKSYKKMEPGQYLALFNGIKNLCSIAYFTASRSTISSTGSLASNSEALAIKAFAISPFK